MTKDDFKISFGLQLEKLRKQQNMSYRAMALRCDVDASDISKIEKGQKDIQLGTIMELARGLNKPPKDLFDFRFDLD